MCQSSRVITCRFDCKTQWQMFGCHVGAPQKGTNLFVSNTTPFPRCLGKMAIRPSHLVKPVLTLLTIKERQGLIKRKFRKAFFQRSKSFPGFRSFYKSGKFVRGPITLQHGWPVVIIARPPIMWSCGVSICKYTPKSGNNSAFYKTTGAYSSQRKEVSRIFTKAIVIWRSFISSADERKRTSYRVLSSWFKDGVFIRARRFWYSKCVLF